MLKQIIIATLSCLVGCSTTNPNQLSAQLPKLNNTASPIASVSPANTTLDVGDAFDFTTEREIIEYQSIDSTKVTNGLKIKLTIFTGREKFLSEFSLGGSRLIEGSKERDQYYEENKILEELIWEKTVGDPKDYQSTTFTLKGVCNFSTKGGDGVSTPITYLSMHLIDKTDWSIKIPSGRKYTFYFDIPDISGIPIERLKWITI